MRAISNLFFARITVAAAMTTGSMVECGREPCPPRPCSTTCSPSDADICGPGRTPITPAGSGVTCCPMTTSGRGKRSRAPSSSIARAPAPNSSAGWITTTRVPDHSFLVRASSSTAPIIAVTCMSWPHACMTPTSCPSASIPVAVLA